MTSPATASASNQRPRPERNGTRPTVFRPEAEAPLPAWPLTLMISWLPLWFILGLSGFTWVIFAAPMAASLVRRRQLVAPKGMGWWIVFLLAVGGSVFSIDSVARLAGWTLRSGYFVAATIFVLYLLNGRRGLDVWTIIRSFTVLWLSTVAGGYLAFVLGDFGFRSPTAYLIPGPLLENDLIRTMVTPSFADLQDIIGFPVPRPKAPYPYTNTWGSLLALLTPFALIALREPRVGLSSRLIKFGLVASLVPGVLSLNRGLWLSLSFGLVYAALRLGVAGESKALRNAFIAALVLVVALVATPLGGVAAARIDTAHSNADRFELIFDAVDGTMERPVFGWGAPRPNDRNLPSVGTHGQLWFIMFSYGFVGAVGYFGAFLVMAWNTRRQRSVSGMWAHVVIIIGLAQVPYYLHVPHQIFVMLAAVAVAIRLQRIDAGIDPDDTDAEIEPVIDLAKVDAAT